MFGVVLRVAILLIGGSLLMVVFKMAGGALASAAGTVGPEGSQNVWAIETTATWLPMIVIGMVVLALVAGAAARRGWA